MIFILVSAKDLLWVYQNTPLFELPLHFNQTIYLNDVVMSAIQFIKIYFTDPAITFVSTVRLPKNVHKGGIITSDVNQTQQRPWRKLCNYPAILARSTIKVMKETQRHRTRSPNYASSLTKSWFVHKIVHSGPRSRRLKYSFPPCGQLVPLLALVICELHKRTLTQFNL